MGLSMTIETAVVAVVLGLGLVLAATAVRHRRTRGIAQILILAVATAFAATAWSVREPPPLETDITFRPIEDPTDGYVTSDTCRSCHPEQHATWMSTYHRTMTQQASPESILGDFNNVTLTLDGEEYRLFRQGNAFVVERPAAPEAIERGAPPRTIAPIVMVTGSHHMQVYWYATGYKRVLGQFEFTFLLDEKRWVPRRAAFVQPPDQPAGRETGRWGTTCISCHTTQPQPWLDERDSRAGEFGISCESCHGPGEEHIRENRDPKRRYQHHLTEGGDETATQPTRLDHKRASEVCGSCHAMTFLHSDEIERFGTSGLTFRPGDSLAETREVGRPAVSFAPFAAAMAVDPIFVDRSFWKDGMIRVAGREYNGLVETPCFQRGELSCLSCHVMHQDNDDPRPAKEWANDLLKPGMDGNAACIGCHEVYQDDEAIEAHTYHPAEGTGSACYNCHMPYTTYGLLKAVRSHQVSNPSVDESLLREDKPHRPNACNLCHLDKTLAWSAEHLEEWYGLKPPELTPDEQAVPASLLWLLRGDAGLRALMAAVYGWEDAQATSDWHWMPPFLTQLLVDPYDAVRLIASRSLSRMPGFDHLAYDPMGTAEDRRAEARRLSQWWSEQEQPPEATVNALELVDAAALPEGAFGPQLFERLLSQRDNRPVALAE